MEDGDRAVTRADLETAIEGLFARMSERIYDTETRLLTAFADYAKASDTRFRKLEADTAN